MPEIKIRKRCKYAGDVFVALLKMGYGIEAANAFCDNIKDADVEEVVRCKDCRFNTFEQPNGIIHCHVSGVARFYKPNDFCSYGEKKGGSSK